MDLTLLGQQPCTVLVEYQVRTENNSVEEWLDRWQLRAEDARTGTAETVTYASAVNLDDPSSVLVYERYARGSDSLKIHMGRAAHADLLDDMGKRSMTKRRVLTTGFVDIGDFGWWTRPEATGQGAQDVILVIVSFRAETDEQRDAFVELVGAHARYCHESEPDTLVYGAGIAVADADREIDVQAGDVLFVMACTDMAAVETHVDDPRHVALIADLAARGLPSASLVKRTYRTTGHGYLWRD